VFLREAADLAQVPGSSFYRRMRQKFGRLASLTTIVIAGGPARSPCAWARVLSARGHRAVADPQPPATRPACTRPGAEPVVADMEHLDDLAEYVDGADAVVFAAGAGAGSGPERKRTVDLGAAVKLLDAARRTGARAT